MEINSLTSATLCWAEASSTESCSCYIFKKITGLTKRLCLPTNLIKLVFSVWSVCSTCWYVCTQFTSNRCEELLKPSSQSRLMSRLAQRAKSVSKTAHRICTELAEALHRISNNFTQFQGWPCLGQHCKLARGNFPRIQWPRDLQDVGWNKWENTPPTCTP